MSEMAATSANADVKSSDNIALRKLSSGEHDSTSDNTYEDGGEKGHSTLGYDDASGYDHSAPLPRKDVSTFKGDESFYIPIEQYEGRHRYDANFAWEPKEEKKLVRKVCEPLSKSQDRFGSLLSCTAGHPHLLLGLLNVLCAPTRPWQYHASFVRQHA